MVLNGIAKSLGGLLACLLVAACVSRTNQIAVSSVAVAANTPAGAPANGALPTALAPVTRGALSGRKQFIGYTVSINPDCTAIGYPNATVTRAPEHGRMTIEKSEVFPNFPQTNVRNVCNTRRVPGISYYYTSDDGFTGRDSFSLETLLPDGTIYKRQYIVLVR